MAVKVTIKVLFLALMCVLGVYFVFISRHMMVSSGVKSSLLSEGSEEGQVGSESDSKRGALREGQLEMFHDALENAENAANKYKHLIEKTLDFAQTSINTNSRSEDSEENGDKETPKERIASSASASSSSSSASTSSGGKNNNNKKNNKKKDIVIGMAQDTDPKNLAVFYSSLRAVSEADVVIFVNEPIPAIHKELAMKNKVKLVPFDLSTLSTIIQNFHPSTLRWSMMYHFFADAAVRNSYGRVWMVDVRDSYFQMDPFEMLNEGERGFYTFKGVENIMIQKCGWNGGWIRDCFGDTMVNKIGHNNIICSGVSMGDMESVYEYLRLMDEVIGAKGKKESVSLGSRFPDCERNGVDQGVHNVLVHNKLIPNLKIWDHTNGPVANLQAKLSPIRGMVVKNKKGDMVAVAHQYDRDAALQKKLFKKYVYWVDTDDPAAMWKAEPTCARFAYKNNADLFKGKCDLKIKGGATSAASCCLACSKVSGCKAFTFFNAQCFLKSCTTQSQSQQILQGAVSGYIQ